MNDWTNGKWGCRGGRGCCSLLKSTVKIFDIYTEESKYIQAAKGERRTSSPSVRGTFGTANTQPIPVRPHAQSQSFLFPSPHQVSQEVKQKPDICVPTRHTHLLSQPIHAIRGGVRVEVVNVEARGRQIFSATVSW